MAYDHVGSALAVTYEFNNMLGFSSSQGDSSRTYNVTDNPGPLFTGFNQADPNAARDHRSVQADLSLVATG